MSVEHVPFASSVLGRRVMEIVSGVVASAKAARGAYRLHGAATRGQLGPVSAQALAENIARGVFDAAAHVRRMPSTPKDMALGTWKPFDVYHGVDKTLAQNLRSREAREARTMAGAGQDPIAFAPHAELSLAAIAAGHRRAERTGWVDKKCDITSRYVRENAHLQGIDRTLRSYAYTAQCRILPRNPTSRNSVLIARAVRAAWARCDGWRSSVAELNVMASTGFSAGELVWNICDEISVATGKNSAVTIPTETICKIAKIYPRNLAFDITTDLPYLCAGPGRFTQTLREPGLHKFLYLETDGSGPSRFRGFGWATDLLAYLAGLSLSKWGCLTEQWGVATPILFYDETGKITDNEIDSAAAALAGLGDAEPAILSRKFAGPKGEGISFTPTPSGLAPMHAQILGYLETGMSKGVLSSVLQTEASPSGNGSFALGEVHRGQGVDIQKMLGCISGEAITTQAFRYLCEANAESWGRAFGMHPDAVVAECPIFEWVISNETPQQRLATLQGVRNLGFALDEEQVREELGVRAPGPQFDGEVQVAPAAPLPAPDGPKDLLPAASASGAPAATDPAAVTEDRDLDEEASAGDDVAAFAAQMTEHAVAQCPHGKSNRCRVCGIERLRTVVPGADGEPPTFAVAWKPIAKEMP